MTHTTALQTTQTALPTAFDTAHIANKTTRYRLNKFNAWTGGRAAAYLNPDLAAYRDALLADGLSARTVAAHLSTVRGAFRKLRNDRDYLYSAAAAMAADGLLPDDWNTKDAVDEMSARLAVAVDPDSARVKMTTVQDADESAFVRLTPDQQQRLLESIDTRKLAGLRDAAMIALALATGARAAELRSLLLDDYMKMLGGQPALLIRHGKGRKQRLIPYGRMVGVLRIVNLWVNRGGITDGYLFRAVKNKGKHGQVLDTPITNYTFERRLARYAVDGLIVKPHDLRRTYARTLYLDGLDIISIQQNLGHANISTTQGYIGVLDASKRAPRRGLNFDTVAVNG